MLSPISQRHAQYTVHTPHSHPAALPKNNRSTLTAAQQLPKSKCPALLQTLISSLIRCWQRLFKKGATSLPLSTTPARTQVPSPLHSPVTLTGIQQPLAAKPPTTSTLTQVPTLPKPRNTPTPTQALTPTEHLVVPIPTQVLPLPEQPVVPTSTQVLPPTEHLVVPTPTQVLTPTEHLVVPTPTQVLPLPEHLVVPTPTQVLLPIEQPVIPTSTQVLPRLIEPLPYAEPAEPPQTASSSSPASQTTEVLPQLMAFWDTTPLAQELWNAVAGGNCNAIRALAERGAPLKTLFPHPLIEGETDSLLHMGCRYPFANAEIVRLLVELGVEVNQRVGGIQKTALHTAASEGREELIEILIELGGEINAETIEGATPLHYAVTGEHLNAVQRLLRYSNIEINRLDREGLTALEYAQGYIRRGEQVGILFKQEIVNAFNELELRIFAASQDSHTE